jgi:hypothetical protein
MAELIADCPRCGANMITFDLAQAIIIEQQNIRQNWYEAFCVCRQCLRSTVFILSQAEYGYDYVQKTGLVNIPGSVNRFIDIKGFISIKDAVKIKSPDHLPDDISELFREGATCIALDCNNAACGMFLQCIDKATIDLLPEGDALGLDHKTRHKLDLRLSWLFDNNYLPKALQDLSKCVKDDYDNSHAGLLSFADAEDLLDFTCMLLERLYTEPERLKIAQQRRESRHSDN